MAGHRHHAQLSADQHHAAFGRAAELGKQFGVAGVIITGIDEDILAQRRGGDGIGDFRERELGRHPNVAEGTVAGDFGRDTGTRISGAKRR